MKLFDVEKVSDDALNLKAWRIILGLLLSPFLLTGWVLSVAWQLVSHPLAAFRHGWRTAEAQVERWKVEARERNAR